MRILCQAGTYIRKIIYDIGEVMASGATMVEPPDKGKQPVRTE